MKLCKKCVVNDNIPGVRFDENGWCNLCRQPGKVRKETNLKEKYAEIVNFRILFTQKIFAQIVELDWENNKKFILLILIAKFVFV